MSLFKQKPVRSKKLRESARDEECTLRLPGVCNWRTDTTVLCHLPDGHGSTGGKTDDFHAVYGCYPCHRVVDGVDDPGLPEADVLEAVRDALARTHRRMIEKGLIKIEGVKQ